MSQWGVHIDVSKIEHVVMQFKTIDYFREVIIRLSLLRKTILIPEY